MDCQWMRRRLPALLEGELSAIERAGAELHLRRCTKCFDEYERRAAADSWTALAAPVRAPQDLNLNIRLALSREAVRENRWDEWKQRLRERAREMFQPLVVRGVGGFVSAMLLFGLLMPDIWRQRSPGQDVPLRYLATAFVAPPTLEAPGPYLIHREVTVVAFIDSHGSVYDIELPSELAGDFRLRAEIANALLFTEFQPATKFGQPIRGQIVLSFTRTTVRA